MRPVLLSILILVAAGAALSDESLQSALPRSVFESPSEGIAGILDPSKLKMSNRVSFLYSGGSGSRGVGLGFYENALTYQVADPLRVTLLLGYQFSPFGRELASGEKAEQFLPGLSVSYQPRPNLFFQFQYQRISAAYSSLYGPRYYGDRFLGE
jgi:hypothetical protein